jgi:RNA polymerase sigma factor (sigma-70 family)
MINVSPGNDLEILELVRKGESRAFELLYKKYWPSLLNSASYYLEDKNTCEEIVQLLFIQLYKRRLELKIRSSLSSYLAAALRNKIFNYLRDQAVYRKHVNHAARNIARDQNTVEQFVDLRDLEEKVDSSLCMMPAKYREVYILYQQHQFTVKKISEVLNRPHDTVDKQLRKARETLRSHLRKEHPNTELARSTRVVRTRDISTVSKSNP